MNEYKKEYFEEISEKLEELSILFKNLAIEYCDEDGDEDEQD